MRTYLNRRMKEKTGEYLENRRIQEKQENTRKTREYMENKRVLGKQ